jgi:uncharacterized protein (DUF952 family)
MREIYHIVCRADWEKTNAGPYRAESLGREGFIHCSNEDQVARVANLFYGDQKDLLVLCIDVERLTSPVRDEGPGTGELFPHVYGPIEREAVVAVRQLQRAGEGSWHFP